jgi:Uma2 family endonuclease
MAKVQIVEPCQRMTRAEYRAWAERQPRGRFERIDGVVVAMAPERVEHNRRKMLAWLVLRRAVHDAKVPYDVCGDGMTVEIGDSDYEPDAVLYCGDRLPPGSVAVPNPRSSSKYSLPAPVRPIERGSCANTFGWHRCIII